MTQRYFLSPDQGEHYVEVAETRWRDIEKSVGFLPTGGFTSGGLTGTMIHPDTIDWRDAVLMVDPNDAAAQIRNQLVCCDIYQRLHDLFGRDAHAYRELRQSNDYHDICFYGEWSARIVEEMGRE